MKKFKSKIKRHHIDYFLLLILFFSIIFLHYYNKNISPKVLYISEKKLEEITTLYIKKDIVPVKKDLAKLINIKTNNQDEIVYVDVNMEYAYEMMLEIVKKIQDNIFLLESGNINYLKNKQQLQVHKGNLYLKIPLFLVLKGNTFSNLGPKIPVKLSFYEHVLGNIDTNIQEYGVNNALLKVYFTLTLEQQLIIPYQEKTFKKDYKVLLGAKVIHGKVPTIYGGSITNSSNKVSLD